MPITAVTAPSPWPRPRVMWRSRSRRCGPGRFSGESGERRRSIDNALHGAVMGPTSMVCPPAGSMTSLRGSASPRASPHPRSRASAPAPTREPRRCANACRLTPEFPYVFCDATFCTVRVGAHVVSRHSLSPPGCRWTGLAEHWVPRSVTASHLSSGACSSPHSECVDSPGPELRAVIAAEQQAAEAVDSSRQIASHPS